MTYFNYLHENKRLSVSNPVPLILGGGYDISSGSTRLSWCAGVTHFFWTPFWRKMTKGLREILRCAPRNQVVIMSGNPTQSKVIGTLLFNTSLQLLGIDYIDIWLELWVKDSRRFNPNVMKWVNKKKQEGKIKLFGISTHRHEIAEFALNRDDIDVIMLRHNSAHRYYEDFFEKNSHLVEKKILITYTSTKWGYLITRDADWPAQNEVPTAADCYAYSLDNRFVDFVLIGPSNREQLESAFNFFEYSDVEWKQKRALLEAYGKHIYDKYGANNSYKLRKKFHLIPR